MRSAMKCAMSAVGLTPCSMSWRVARANLQPLLVAVVPLGDPRVKIPAVVIKARGVCDGGDGGQIETFQRSEADDYIGDLHAGVIDVVLHFDGCPAKRQDAHQGVAERGVSQVANVRGFVGVDGRVLDNSLALGGSAARRRRQDPDPLLEERRPVDEDVEVAVGRGRDASDAIAGGETCGDLLGNRLGRLAQAPGQLECDRRAEIAHGPIGRRFDGDVDGVVMQIVRLA